MKTVWAALAGPNVIGHPLGVCPHVPVQVVREYVSAYAAIAPALDQMVSLILPEVPTTMMNLFLAQVSQIW